MTKIMLVEDDNNLREIYEARLLAEGYEIVSAKDGEEALALAVKEKPDLIISDVMMPKISGFDMLDILRSTPETKDTKVIMMTALSQTEDKARADKLGADRYLVKSQVTLEDVAKVAHEVLTGESSDAAADSAPSEPVAAPAAAEPVTPDPAPAADPVTEPQDTPAEPAAPANDVPVASAPTDDATPAPAPEPEQPAPVVTDPTSAAPVVEPVNSVAVDAPAADDQVIEPAAESVGAKANELADTVNQIVQESTPEATADTSTDSSSAQQSGKKIIAPISTPSEAPNLDSLLAVEEQKQAEADAAKGVTAPVVAVADANLPVAEAPAAPAPATDTPATPPPGNVVSPNDPTNVAL